MNLSTTFEFDGSEELAALTTLLLLLERSPDLCDFLVSRFGATADTLDDFIEIPLMTSATNADKVIVRLQPSEGLSELLSAIATAKGRDDPFNIGSHRAALGSSGSRPEE